MKEKKKEVILDLIVILMIGCWTYFIPDISTIEDKYPILVGALMLLISRLKSIEKIDNAIKSFRKEIVWP